MRNELLRISLKRKRQMSKEIEPKVCSREETLCEVAKRINEYIAELEQRVEQREVTTVVAFRTVRSKVNTAKAILAIVEELKNGR